MKEFDYANAFAFLDDCQQRAERFEDRYGYADAEAIREKLLECQQVEARKTPKWPLFKYFHSVWWDFFKRETGGLKPFGPNEKGKAAAAGKKLNQIIGWLVEQTPDKSEETALQGWAMLLSPEKWALQSPFIRRQLTLDALEKHLAEIILVAKNGKSADPASRADKGRSAAAEALRRVADRHKPA